MSYTIEPARYPCPTHDHIDLTSEVMREVFADPVLVIGSPALTPTALELDIATGRAGDSTDPRGPFYVTVSCPGTPAGSGGKAAPHDLGFSGVVR